MLCDLDHNVIISIHALREEGDCLLVNDLVKPQQFLSTPSARRATTALKSSPPLELFLSTPSARRATTLLLAVLVLLEISIHALREEGDPFPCVFGSTPINFYPRPPRGGRRFCK